jgi:hypothetical protein
MKIRGAFQRFYNSGEGGSGDVLPPAVPPAPAPAPAPAPRAGYLTCDGCGCALDSQGKIIRRGDGLKSHLDREDEVSELRKRVATLEQTEGELRAEVARLTPPAKRRSILM